MSMTSPETKTVASVVPVPVTKQVSEPEVFQRGRIIHYDNVKTWWGILPGFFIGAPGIGELLWGKLQNGV
ncbi:hypothetical protein RDB90_004769 [Salmonella enterica]|nr:hypothetical protein [Salmonella enterica]EEI9428485.1 hypothetical protein [Salmonella enterica subsp. diarizonae]EAQ1550200.1 hypothetical protein [Salmonella enterica]EBG6879632.1 hypothetical protein [Salmonella enterica]EBG9220889.1 hypothetical protein [Salmonella enterica]